MSVKFSRWKDYLYEDSSVLVNKKNIHDKNVLLSAEKDYVALRMLELLNNPIKGEFDFKHLSAIHYHLFQDLYEWAGEIRACNMYKNGVYPDGRKMHGMYFCLVEQIEGYLTFIFEQLKRENYFLDYDYDTKIVKLAALYNDLNAVHPFREGNGRAQREFVESLAKINGIDLDITKIKPIMLINAAIEGFYRSNDMLEELFRQNATQMTTEEQIECIKKICTPELAERLIQRLLNPKNGEVKKR
jgi:cell filamentation protein